MKKAYQRGFFASISLTVLIAATPGISLAQTASDASVPEEANITVLGSRRAQPRSNADSPVPVDVLKTEDLKAQGSTNIIDTMSAIVPSINANRQPINDAATLVRPVNLRSLPADDTLILVNGKRRHRGAVVGEAVSGINRGAQGVDVEPLFSDSLRQVEVLRDGAAAQYGSDAIAGVVNYTLVSDPDVRRINLQYGRAYEGDGTTLEASGAFGMHAGDDGFVTFAFDIKDQDATSRGIQDAGAAALAAAGFPVANPVVTWGQPNVKNDYKFAVNSMLPLSDVAEAYAFGTYATRDVDGSFYYRNPSTRANVFVNPTNGNALFADTTGAGGCPVGPLPTSSYAAAQAFVNSAPANCFTFLSAFPGGFTPRFGGKVTDKSAFAGVRSARGETFSYDFSVGFGSNEVDYRITNTINASLGPDSQRSFYLGSQKQAEVVANADFSYGIEAGLASPINVAWGAQFQKETFTIGEGERASYEVGPYASQGFSIGANGFPGFSDTVAGNFRRHSTSAYLDLETDVTSALTLSAAGRYEKFSDFGDTFNYKFSGIYHLTSQFAVRGSYSTGFRAPTLGQSNLRRSSTVFTNGALAEGLTIGSTDPVAVYFGGGQLQPEKSKNISVGVTANLGKLTMTLDYFNIRVKDRIGQVNHNLTAADVAALTALGIPNAAGLSQVTFFVNDFDTRNQGVDLVASLPVQWSLGKTDLTLAFNWTDVKVTRAGQTVNAAAKVELEKAVPAVRATATIAHTIGKVDGLLRFNFYGKQFSYQFNDPTTPIQSPELLIVDAEAGYQINDVVRLSVGAKNLLDTYPQKWSGGYLPGSLGAIYPLNHVAGFNGGSYYLRISANL